VAACNAGCGESWNLEYRYRLSLTYFICFYFEARMSNIWVINKIDNYFLHVNTTQSGTDW
jgi:hypothetical protein